MKSNLIVRSLSILQNFELKKDYLRYICVVNTDIVSQHSEYCQFDFHINYFKSNSKTKPLLLFLIYIYLIIFRQQQYTYILQLKVFCFISVQIQQVFSNKVFTCEVCRYLRSCDFRSRRELNEILFRRLLSTVGNWRRAQKPNTCN